MNNKAKILEIVSWIFLFVVGISFILKTIMNDDIVSMILVSSMSIVTVLFLIKVISLKKTKVKEIKINSNLKRTIFEKISFFVLIISALVMFSGISIRLITGNETAKLVYAYSFPITIVFLFIEENYKRKRRCI